MSRFVSIVCARAGVLGASGAVAAQATSRVSLDSGGAQGNGDSSFPIFLSSAISADGRYVVFESTAMTSLCDPGAGGVIACPCANPPGAPGRGCDNSAATGGASLAASGGAYLYSDGLVFTTAGEKPTATSILLQGTSSPASGVTYG